MEAIGGFLVLLFYVFLVSCCFASANKSIDHEYDLKNHKEMIEKLSKKLDSVEKKIEEVEMEIKNE